MLTAANTEPVDLYVCVTCLPASKNPQEERPGMELHRHLQTALQQPGLPDVRLHTVECLCVCTRPCTVLVSSPSKWSYIIAGLDPGLHTQDVCHYVKAYAASEAGTPPLKERPAAIRSGTVARIPPRKG